MFWIHDNGLKENEHIGFINDWNILDLCKQFKLVVEMVEQFQYGDVVHTLSVSSVPINRQNTSVNDYFKYILNQTYLGKMSIYKRDGFRIFPMNAWDSRSIRHLIDLDFNQFSELFYDFRFLLDSNVYSNTKLSEISEVYQWDGI